MPTILGTAGNDTWTVVNPGSFVIDGLAGIDTLNFGTELSSSYIITEGAKGAVLVDSVSSASGAFHATLFNFEKLVFSNQTVDLATLFVDTIAPTVVSFNPAAQTTGFEPNKNIVITFSEAIVRGTGTITLKTSDGAVVASYDAASSSNLAFSGSTLAIDPTLDLDFSKSYTIAIAAGAVKDLKGNAYAGSNAYTFTTGAGITVTGTSSNDTLNGGAGNDSIAGLGGNDSITGGAGNDSIDGGAGTDSAIFSGHLSSYNLSHVGSTYTVRDKTGSDGTDTLVNIESLKFTDLTVNLTVQAIAAAAPQANVNRVMELYVAFFNRVPDADGMAYWIGQMGAGLSTNQIAETFYSIGVQFSSLTGFSATMSNADFINLVYRNVLGRPDGADPGGLAYWTGKLASGSETHGSLVSTILGAAHGFKGDVTWGWVANLLDNKITVAKTFAVDWGLGYALPDDSIVHGMAIAAAVTPTDTSAALALVGISPLDINLV